MRSRKRQRNSRRARRPKLPMPTTMVGRKAPEVGWATVMPSRASSGSSGRGLESSRGTSSSPASSRSSMVSTGLLSLAASPLAGTGLRASALALLWAMYRARTNARQVGKRLAGSLESARAITGRSAS